MINVSTELVAAGGTLLSLNFLFAYLHKHKLARIAKKRKEACQQVIAYAFQVSGHRFQYGETNLAYLIASYIEHNREVDVMVGPDERKYADIEQILALALPLTWALRLDAEATCYLTGTLLGHTVLDKRSLEKVKSVSDEDSLLGHMERDLLFMTGLRRQKTPKDSVFSRLTSDKKMLEARKALSTMTLPIQLPSIPSDYKVDLR